LDEDPDPGGEAVGADAAEPGICGEIGVEVRPDLVRRDGLEHHGHTSGDELHALHYADVVGGRQHAERLHTGAEQVGRGFGELLPGDYRRRCALEQRIVDVGYVLHGDRLPTGIPPHPNVRVVGDVGRRVPEVGGVVG